MPMDPHLWASVPYRNPTALIDFYGTLELWHRTLADHVFRTTGATYRTYPLGDGGGEAWLRALEQQYRNAYTALGLGAPPDLSSYDLSRPEDHASFFWTLSQTSVALRNAAGLP